MDMEKLESELIRDEALKLKPYLDCCGKYWRDCRCIAKGKLTIGIGRNLDDVGISREEAMTLFDGDVADKTQGLDRLLPWWKQLSDARQRALVNLAFNLGVRGLIVNNPKTVDLLQKGDYLGASQELLNGPWKTQVGGRAQRLSDMLKNG